eukprot:548481-Rhodomonas_salina.2
MCESGATREHVTPRRLDTAAQPARLRKQTRAQGVRQNPTRCTLHSALASGQSELGLGLPTLKRVDSGYSERVRT